jgi:hypothetical protein
MFQGTWLLLLVSLPPRPSSLRVRVWRKLRALGAVAIKSAAYLLPSSPDHDEQLQWLAQDIQRDGGEATLLKIDRMENVTNEEIVRRFQEAREQEYAAIAERYRKLATGRPRRAQDELGRLAREMDRLTEIDFFEAPGRQAALRAREVAEARLSRSWPAPGRRAAAPPLDLQALKGRRWATRPRPHVDRVASAWLIKRFLDPDARFVFAAPDEAPADAIPFDTAGADLGHHGEDCTFETILRRSGLADRRLAAIAEIVHEADLRDEKFRRDEARGLDLVLRGLLTAVKDDHEALERGLTIFDGLYAVLGERRR